MINISQETIQLLHEINVKSKFVLIPKRWIREKIVFVIPLNYDKMDRNWPYQLSSKIFLIRFDSSQGPRSKFIVFNELRCFTFVFQVCVLKLTFYLQWNLVLNYTKFFFALSFPYFCEFLSFRKMIKHYQFSFVNSQNFAIERYHLKTT